MASLSHYSDILLNYPAIDNHAHPLLAEENRDQLAFEGLTSEAEGMALQDAVYTLAHTAARGNLIQLYDLPRNASWEDIKKHRAARTYDDLCRLCFRKAKIQCILIDDGLGGVKEMAEGYQWHDRYMHSPTRRIVRVEVVAQVRTWYHHQSLTTPAACRSRKVKAIILFLGHHHGNSWNGRRLAACSAFDEFLRDIA
jgi:hypothetical protein